MSKTEALIELFHEHGDRLTLGQILENWQRIGSKYTGRISDARKILRNDGKDIILQEEHKERPTENVYVIQRVFDQNGQRMFA